MYHSEYDERIASVLSLCAEDEARGRRRGRHLLLFLGALTAVIAALSFSLSKQGAVSEGELYRAVAFVEDFTEDHRALAVFLGLGETKDSIPVGGKEDEIARRAEQYIQEHGG